MLAADVGFGDDLAALSDEFADSASISAWVRVNEVENWNADQLETWNIDQTQAGRMVMQPHTTVWYQDWRGPMAFKEVTGDFVFTTEVHVSDRDDIGGSDADDVPGDGQFSLGGVMIRTPRNIADPQADWAPGSQADDGTNNGENYVFLSMGYGNGADEFSLEVKTTRNSNSQLELTPINSNTATLQIARIGDTVITLYRLPGQEWQVHRRYTRADMPETIQVGLVSYTNWEKASDFDPFLHNSSVLIPGQVADPTPAEPFDPDLTAGFEYARFARPQVPGELEGVDLVNAASDGQLLSFLGDSVNQPPADEDLSLILDAIGDVTMTHAEDLRTVGLPSVVPNGGPLAYTTVLVGQVEFVLDQQHDFYAEGDFYENWGGMSERWIRGDGDGWFYLLPGGDLYQWNGSFETSPLIAELAPIVYEDPTLLIDAALPATVSVDGNQLTIDPVDGFIGSFEVEISAYIVDSVGEPAGVGVPAATKQITVTVTNAAPTIDSIADQSMSRLDDELRVAYTASDPDGDLVAIMASVVQPLTYQLDQEYDFTSSGDYFDNWGGQNERWVNGNGAAWFYLLPTGELHQWEGGFDMSPLVAALDPSVYNDPTLLTQAQPIAADVFVDGNEVVVDPAFDYVGSFEVVVSASDGLESVSTQFTVVVNNSDLVLSPIDDLVIVAGTGPVQTLITASSDGVVISSDLLDVSVETIESPAAQLDAAFDLQTAANFYTNWGGQNEKWLQDAGGNWFFILPDGGFHQWNGSFESSELLATLDPSFYDDPNLIADPEWIPATVSVVDNLLTVDPDAGFTGIFEIRVTVSDGYNTVIQFVNVTVEEPAAQADVLPVLMVISNQDFYYQEYADTRASLEAAGISVVVAAATLDTAVPHGNSGQGADGGLVQPDIALADASAAEYSAIVFVGGWGSSSYQYSYEGTYDNAAYNGSEELRSTVNDLINEFVGQDKYIAAICHGVSVLAWARVDGESLLDGHTVSAWGGISPSVGGVNESTRVQIEANGATMVASGSIGDPTTVEDDVIVDGNIITAENYDSASAFGAVIADLITDADYLSHVDEIYSNWE